MSQAQVKVKVYSTNTCPYCDMVKEFLTKNNVEFEEVDVSTDMGAAQEMVKKTGQMGVPVTEIEKDGKFEFIVGFEKDKLKKVLNLK